MFEKKDFSVKEKAQSNFPGKVLPSLFITGSTLPAISEFLPMTILFNHSNSLP